SEVLGGPILSGGVDLLVDLGFDLNGSGSDLLRRLTGVDERRCLLSSGLISASSVLPCLLLRLLCKELPHLTFGPRCKGESEAFAGDFFSVLISKQPPWRLASGVDFKRLWWPDQDLVTPASPVLHLKSPLGQSAVPLTVLRLSTLLIPSLVTGSGNEFHDVIYCSLLVVLIS
ncbi:unnamed protein product, partial [Brassica rapa subsp. trilocularis]